MQAQLSLIEIVIKSAQNANGIIYGGIPRNQITRSAGHVAFDNNCNIYFKNSDAVAEFKAGLERAHLWYRSYGRHKMHTYGGMHPVDPKIMVERLECSFYLPRVLRDMLPAISLNVDVVTGQFHPFAQELDMECNGIMINPEGEYKLFPCLLNNCMTPLAKVCVMNRIIQDVQQKKTTLLSHYASKQRIMKLVQANWNIHASSCTIICNVNLLNKPSNPIIDTCSICLNNVNAEDAPFIKLKCCQGCVHAACAVEWSKKSVDLIACPRCNSHSRSACPFLFDQRDLQLLRALDPVVSTTTN